MTTSKTSASTSAATTATAATTSAPPTKGAPHGADATAPARDPRDIPVTGAPACPKCGGRMWDNRASKRNPKAPDFKCRSRTCDGVLWPGQHKSVPPIFPPKPRYDSADASDAAPIAPADERPQEQNGSQERQGRAGDRNAPPPQPPTSRRTTHAESPARRETYRIYLALTDFVLAEVRPVYQHAGVPCTDATVAAMVNVLFAAICRGTDSGQDGAA